MVKILDELKNVHSIIFDLDGTLLDSMQLWQDIDREYITKHGGTFDPIMSETIKHMSFKESATYFRNTFHIDKDEETIQKEWTEMAAYKYANEVKLKDGVIDFLKAMKENNIQMYIVTSCLRSHALSALQHYDITSYFEDIYFCLELQLNKNEPDVFLKCCKDHHLNSNECIVFDDLYKVLEMTKNEGFYTVGVEDVLSHRQQHLFMNCDYYIKSFNELL